MGCPVFKRQRQTASFNSAASPAATPTTRAIATAGCSSPSTSRATKARPAPARSAPQQTAIQRVVAARRLIFREEPNPVQARVGEIERVTSGTASMGARRLEFVAVASVAEADDPEPLREALSELAKLGARLIMQRADLSTTRAPDCRADPREGGGLVGGFPLSSRVGRRRAVELARRSGSTEAVTQSTLVVCDSAPAMVTPPLRD